MLEVGLIVLGVIVAFIAGIVVGAIYVKRVVAAAMAKVASFEAKVHAVQQVL